MFKVMDGKNPYTEIGEYIRNHITAIEDIIATIEIDGIRTNELFMVDMEEDGYFVWQSDWYEGEKNIVLIDFFPVSEAINSSIQPDVLDTNVGDTISRQAATDALAELVSSMSVCISVDECHGMKRMQGMAVRALDNLPSAQPEPKWIPVKERLPEKYKDVLATYTIQPWRSKKPKRFVHIAEWMGDGWKSPIDEYLVRDEVAKIRYLAWMPLPEPWRGEEK